jgi:protein tyrosine phosphatase (PTP) superfamily phosphohydrolase (DUF442 family)
MHIQICWWCVFCFILLKHGENLSAGMGMGYNKILENLIVGSQPESDTDIQRLFGDEGVRVILNLLTDDDIKKTSKYDIESRNRKCKGLDIRHKHIPIQDFDEESVQKELPRAVAELQWAISLGKMVYVHCNAGMGRSPGVALAYLYWFGVHPDLKTLFTMDSAYDFFTKQRAGCGRNEKAIRGATYYLAKKHPNPQKFQSLPHDAFKNISEKERKLLQDRVRKLRAA